MSYELLQSLIVAAAVLSAALAATRRWWRPLLLGKTAQRQGASCGTGSGCGSGCGSCGSSPSSVQVDDLMRELRQRRP